MKKVLLAIAALFIAVAPAVAQTIQINPVNSYTTAAGANTAVVTITGVAGQRVRLHAVSIYCGGATSMVPAVQVTDGGALALDAPGVTGTVEQNPSGQYRWSPGFAFTLGATVVITGNPGNACTGGTFMTIQADQF